MLFHIFGKSIDIEPFYSKGLLGLTVIYAVDIFLTRSSKNLI
jgi:hypothetical protein